MISRLLIDANPTNSSDGRRMLLDATGESLPADYLDWVDVFGGSSLSDYVNLPDENGNAVLRMFYTAEQAATTYRTRSGFACNVPRRFIVVGFGPGGGVCLSLSDLDFGSVWFADYDAADDIIGADDFAGDDDAELGSIMTRISHSWGDFLKSY